MTSTAGPPVPPGWYSDPAGSGQLRWWNGTAWTAHLAPPTAATPTPVVQTPPAFSAQPILPSRGQSYGTVSRLRSSGSGYGYGDDVMSVDLTTPMRWNTGWVWLLTFSWVLALLLGAIAALLATALGGGAATPDSPALEPALVISVVVYYLIILIAAFSDRRIQRDWGFMRPASPGWILLFSPLLYLILRTVRQRSETHRGGAPLWTYIAVNICLLPIASAVAIPVYIGVENAAESAQIQAQLTNGMDSHGGNYAVACPPGISTVIGSQFSCTATDQSTGATYSLAIEIVAGTDGQPTIKLDSVTPPIS